MKPERSMPIVAIVGRSNTGKTTLVEGLVRELVARGHRVATVKSDAQGTEIAIPGTDPWRHAQAGAIVSMLATPRLLATVEQRDVEPRLSELAEKAGVADILIAEGFAASAPARIEVLRPGISDTPRFTPDQLVGIVTEGSMTLPGYEGLARFEPGEISELATFVERAYLAGGSGISGR